MFNFFKKRSELNEADEFFFRFPQRLRLQFQPADVFLTSFPRSGNTWMRHLIAGCLRKPVEHVIPDLHHPGLNSVPRYSLGGDVFLFKSHTICDLDEFRKVYIFRNPSDSLVSYAHFAGRSEGGCDNFVCRSLKTWVHQNSAVHTAFTENPSRWHLVSYEKLLRETESTLLSTFQFLGIDYSGLAMEEAIRDSEKVPRLNKGVGNYVSASSGKGKTLLSKSTLQQIEDFALPTYSRLREAEDEQNLKK